MHKKLGTPEFIVSYVSTKAKKLSGKAKEYAKNAANSPSCVLLNF